MRRSILTWFLLPMILTSLFILHSTTLGKIKSGSTSTASESREGPFPIFPGAVKDPNRGGATSLQPGRNYRFTHYTVDKPPAEVLSFYESHLKDYQRSENADGSVKLTTLDGSVRLSGSPRQTRIEFIQGPL